MRLVELYKSKKYTMPIVTIIFAITCLIVSIPTYFDNNLIYIFATFSKPFFFWQYFSGIFEHTIFNLVTGEPAPMFLFLHLGINLIILLLFGLIIERNLGSNKMFIITFVAGAINILADRIITNNILNMENTASVGASGVVYAYVPIALYIIVQALKEKKNYNQGLTYVYAVTIILIYIVITCIASFSATNIWHLIATVIGIIFLFIYKKSIHREFSEKILGNNTTKIKMNKALLGLIIIPLLMIGILVAYKCQIIQSPFMS